MAKISVVMATFNQAATLPRAIDSILAQTLADFEFIIVDDGSSDDTPAILRDYTKKDKRIRTISQSNQGLARARNKGVARASGNYLAFMDSDDACAINRLEIQYNFLEQNLNLGACTVPRNNPKIEDYKPGIRSKFNGVYLTYRQSPFRSKKSFTVLGALAMMRRKSFTDLGGYRPQEAVIEDLDFTLRYTAEHSWGALEASDFYFYTYPSRNPNTSLVNKDILKFAKRNAACYISEWHRVNELPDPVEQGETLDEILAAAKYIPRRDRLIIYRNISYLRYNMKILGGMSNHQSKSYLLKLIGQTRFERLLIRALLKLSR